MYNSICDTARQWRGRPLMGPKLISRNCGYLAGLSRSPVTGTRIDHPTAKLSLPISNRQYLHYSPSTLGFIANRIPPQDNQEKKRHFTATIANNSKLRLREHATELRRPCSNLHP
ncbi:hypothetical protein ALC62_11031 [Cyphomyrmex costatus]|uniref:Uncharacterized protein n=1 Tax=Cyphomyrmex costatus TaxID=456900 RepID=A0A151ICZ7_9HYME|nr:hypothetical protein ALC62_11031 [Cyphomyrmex costatus]